MIEDNGNNIFAYLQGCFYVPGLSKCLFSIYCVAALGHQATIHHKFVTLFFSIQQQPVTIPIIYNAHIAFHAKTLPLPSLSNKTTHQTSVHHIPDHTCSRPSKKLSTFKIRMDTEQDYVSCKIATIQASPHNTYPHTY